MARKPATDRPASAKARSVKAKHTGEPAPKRGPERGAVKARAYPRRADLNQPGEAAIERMPEPHRSIARAADGLIRRTLPGVTSVVKWGNACYFLDGRGVAALCQTKRGVNLMLAGGGAPDPNGLLEGTGKTMRHAKLTDAVRVASPALAELIRASAREGLAGM
jgi:hypothetical protein